MNVGLKSRKTAILITVFLIVLSLILGSSMKLRARYRAVERAFYKGTDSTGMNISSALSDREETARNLVSVASRYRAGDEVKKVVSLCEELSKQKGISEKFSANKRLGEAVYSLYTAMQSWGLSDKDEEYRVRLYARFSSINDTISHDGYNELAAKYNELVSVFPANLASVVGGVPRAPYFSEFDK